MVLRADLNAGLATVLSDHLVTWILVSFVSSALHRFSTFSLERFSLYLVLHRHTVQSLNMSEVMQQAETCTGLTIGHVNNSNSLSYAHNQQDKLIFQCFPQTQLIIGKMIPLF